LHFALYQTLPSYEIFFFVQNVCFVLWILLKMQNNLEKDKKIYNLLPENSKNYLTFLRFYCNFIK